MASIYGCKYDIIFKYTEINSSGQNSCGLAQHGFSRSQLLFHLSGVSIDFTSKQNTENSNQTDTS